MIESLVFFTQKKTEPSVFFFWVAVLYAFEGIGMVFPLELAMYDWNVGCKCGIEGWIEVEMGKNFGVGNFLFISKLNSWRV